MLPRNLRCFSVIYCSSFLYGVLPFAFKKGRFVSSKLGIELWTGQLFMTLVMNACNYIDSLASPCNNALSCAIYIQGLLNGVTVLLQVLLVLYNRVQICGVLDALNAVCAENAREDNRNRSSYRCKLPIVYNTTFTLFTVGRCIFMFALKPKTPLIQMVQFLCTVTQIQIENISMTLIYIAAAEFKSLNRKLESLDSPKELEQLQNLHLLLHGFCRQTEKSFGLNITISVFTVLTQLLLMTFFETTLNIRPLKRNLMMDLYLMLNVLYAIVNLARIAVICKGCDLIHEEYKETALKLENLVSSSPYARECQSRVEAFTAQVQLLKFRFTGCSMFTISMELVTEIVSAVSIYATTIVSFTTFSSDTSAVYSSYVKKGT